MLGGAMCLPAYATDQPWSPDGKWLAVLTDSGGSEFEMPPGWWRHIPTQGDSSRTSQPEHSLWICQRDTGRCWRLATSSLGMSPPAWSPDGRHIAYVRGARANDGRLVAELVVQQGFDPPRPFCVWPIDEAKPSVNDAAQTTRVAPLPPEPPVWSPQSNYIACRNADGTSVVRVSDGKVVGQLAGTSPSWSPDETQLAFVRSGDAPGYHVSSVDFAVSRLAVSTAHARVAAVWERSGQSFRTVVWSEHRVAPNNPLLLGDLIRYDVVSRRLQVIRRVFTRSLVDGVRPPDLLVAAIPGTDRLLLAVADEQRTLEILELDPERRTEPRRFALFDPAILLSRAGVSPDLRQVAVTFGRRGLPGTPALFDLQTSHMQPLVPDRATQVRASQFIADLLLRQIESAPAADGAKPTPGWVRLPSPSSYRSLALRDGRVTDRVERLARFGQDVLRVETEQAPSDVHRQGLAESEMIFSYVTGSYADTLRATDVLEPLASRGDDRLGLAIVRVQCYLGLARWTDAQNLLAVLSDKASRIQNSEPPNEAADQTPLTQTIRRLERELQESQKEHNGGD
jgi:hypothetical protein